MPFAFINVWFQAAGSNVWCARLAGLFIFASHSCIKWPAISSNVWRSTPASSVKMSNESQKVFVKPAGYAGLLCCNIPHFCIPIFVRNIRNFKVTRHLCCKIRPPPLHACVRWQLVAFNVSYFFGSSTEHPNDLDIPPLDLNTTSCICLETFQFYFTGRGRLKGKGD